jgi:asparagine synthase (glutamine-hydrolysing)
LGGELLRCVQAFKYALPRGDFVNPIVVKNIAESADAFSGASSTNHLSNVLFHQIPMQGYGRYAIERSQVLMRAPFLHNEVVKCLYQRPTSMGDSRDLSIALIKRRPELLCTPTDVGLLGQDPAPIRFARRAYRKMIVKAEYLTSHGAPHWLAALCASLPAQILETRFLGRNKFQHFRLWIRNELADFVRDSLGVQKNSPMWEWFDMQRVSSMVKAHINGECNYTDEIDKVLTIMVAEKSLLAPTQAAETTSNVQSTCVSKSNTVHCTISNKWLPEDKKDPKALRRQFSIVGDRCI